MDGAVYCARRLIKSNLGWFHKTRETIGEASGRERAININREVFDEWFPELDHEFSDPIHITTRYFADHDTSLFDSIYIDERTIRRQGGGKNWRLAGDAIQGDYYDMREGDIMLMAYERSTCTLSWTVCRGNQDAERLVPNIEYDAWEQLNSSLGEPHRNMWLLEKSQMLDLVNTILPFQPLARELIFDTLPEETQEAPSDEENASLRQLAFDPSGAFEGKEVVTKAVAIRKGQANFRQTLLIAYRGSCCVTSSKIPQVLEAAHIIPYNGAESNNPQNGLLLRSDIHTLFDLGYLTIASETFEVHLHSDLIGSEYDHLNGKQIFLPTSVFLHPSSDALRHHNEYVFLGAKE